MSAHQNDGFTTTFVVATPRAEAWDRLATAAPAADWLPEPGPGQWWLPGFEGAADPLEVDEGHRLRARKAGFPCAGTEIVVTMEDAGTGTRITVTQFGFGPDFDDQRAWLATGWPPIAADLAVWFERGVALGRHLTPWAGLGCAVTEAPVGLVVGEVEPDRLAARVGLAPGDLVVALDGAPVTSIAELSILVRGPVRTGAEAEVRWLRGTELLAGAATV